MKNFLAVTLKNTTLITSVRVQFVKVGIVGGSDLVKIEEQLGQKGEPVREGPLESHPRYQVGSLDEHHLTPPLAASSDYDYCFSENGLVAHQEGQLLAVQSLKKELGELSLKRFINFILHYIADLDIPIKRGTFVEFRKGMLNVSPIGRNCSQEERDDFQAYDEKAGIR